MINPTVRSCLGPNARRFVCATIALLLALLPMTFAAAQQTRVISGVIVDRESAIPVAQALLRIQNTSLQTTTAADGTFRITVPVGRQVLTVEHIAYGSHSDTVQVLPDQDARLQIRISRQAIQLTPVVVEAETDLERRRRTAGHAFNELRREQIDAAQQKGFNLAELLRDGMISVRVSGERRGGSYCVEHRGGAFTSQVGSAGNESRQPTTCREVAVFIDGARMSAPSSVYSMMPLRDVERIEMLSPAEAGTRYGIVGGRGVLLIETRQGPVSRRPERPKAILIGTDWSAEAQPYRWARVAGSSVLGSAVGLGLGLLVADQCFKLDAGINGLRSKCNAVTTVGTGFVVLGLPGVSSGLAAHWAGATDRSSGRIVPSALLSTITAATGYLLIVEGESGGRRRTAGTVILTVGPPLIATLADRLFRGLR